MENLYQNLPDLLSQNAETGLRNRAIACNVFRKRRIVAGLRKTCFLLIAFLSAYSVCEAQVTQEWLKTYAGPVSADADVRDMVIDAAGNVYITGLATNGANLDISTVKYSPAGVELWARTYNGPGNSHDLGIDMAVDAAGNVYVTGWTTTGPNNDFDDFVTIKYDAAGVQQWASIYNGTGNKRDNPNGIAVDAAGNVYVTGFSSNGTNWDATTIKYNAAGAQQWVRIYNGSENDDDYGTDIALDAAGNPCIVGSTNSLTNTDFLVIKYDAAGTQLWMHTYGSSGVNFDQISGDQTHGLVIDAAGGVYVTGSNLYSGNNRNITTIKYNSAGVQQWISIFDTPTNGSEMVRDIGLDACGNIYITGVTGDGTFNGNDYLTVKYNAAGVEQWFRTYGGSGDDNDLANALALDASGNVYVTGRAFGGAVGADYEYATVKYDASGTEQWVITYNGLVDDGLDYGYGIAVDASEKVYVTGLSYNPETTITSIVTIKYIQGYPYYQDADNDGFGNIDEPIISQTQPVGYVSDYTDCDDTDATTYPGATEQCDGKDHNCDGIILPVMPVPVIAVTPGPGPSNGGTPNTIYFGYGPQYVTLQVSGATDFSWSPVAGLSDPLIANPIFTPTTAGTYTFTITSANSYGCQTSASVVITVIEARCGSDKILLCHTGHDNCVSSSAVPSHLAHGDYLGSCNSGNARQAASPVVNEGVVMKAEPNPFRDFTDLNFTFTTDGYFHIALLDMKGSLVRVFQEGNGNAGNNFNYQIAGKELPAGIYIVRLVTANGVKHLKLILNK